MITSSLKKHITIEKLNDLSSNVMPETPSYSDYLTTYAGVYVRSGVSRYGESESFVYVTEFTIRYTSISKAINNEYRVKYNDQTYNIIEVIETEPRHTIKIIGEHFYGE